MSAIDDLPTEKEREVARKIASILRHLPSAQRQEVLQKVLLQLQISDAARNMTGGKS